MKKEKEDCSKNALKNINYRLRFIEISKDKIYLDIKILRERIKEQLELRETTNEFLHKMSEMLDAIKAINELTEEEKVLKHIKKDYENE